MFVEFIKKILPETVKRKLFLLFVSFRDPQWMKYASTSHKRIFVFLAGFYQNLGDMAITYAQVQFLKSVFPDGEVIPVSSGLTYSSIKTIKGYIRPDDIITITGGGNMDDLYPSLEEARRFVIKSFPNNRIVSFPQTVHYSNTSRGKKELRKSRKIYEKHKKLIIYAREEDSLKRITDYFPNIKAGLCPDIVLFLNNEITSSERRGIMCCLRKDKEQLIGTDLREEIIKTVKYMFDDVIVTDTTDIPISSCKESEYENTLREFMEKLSSCQVVLTDRLHCMLFCVLTKTPCVVIDNNNQKISGVYKTWLKDCFFIKMIDDYSLSNITNEMLALSKKQANGYRNAEIDNDFMLLKEALLEQ